MNVELWSAAISWSFPGGAEPKLVCFRLSDHRIIFNPSLSNSALMHSVSVRRSSDSCGEFSTPREDYAMKKKKKKTKVRVIFPGFMELTRRKSENSLAIEDLIELRPDPDATSSYRDQFDRGWARRWPMEHIWRVRKARV